MFRAITNPSLMIQNGYASRSIPSFDAFKDVYEQRIKAKKEGNKVLANTYKLILNTCYGATLSRTNPLCDPLHARSVCISGQLYLIELASHLYKDIPELKVVELNTDGVQVEFDERYLDDVRAIVHEWEERTHFGMEEEEIELNISKDVNNYVQKITGETDVKVKGGMLVRGIAPAGAFNINNNLVIVAEALRDYLADGIDPEITILDCDEMLKFQMVAKASHKYSHVYHIKNGERIEVQRCNRVYASKDPTDGTLIKVHAERGNDNKISGLPEHCLIDNKNRHSLNEVDKQWYIDLCWEQIQAFLGYDPRCNTEKEQGNMAATKTTAASASPRNVYQKLLEARTRFQQECVKKSGKNMKLAFKYFELSDIVPVATKIFDEVGLIPIVTFDEHLAIMNIINTDNPEDFVPFTAPMREVEPIVSSTTGGVVNNALMRLGSSITYMRRYLYMVALDVVEADEIEASAGYTPQEARTEAKTAEPVKEDVKPAPARTPAPVRKAPTSTAERAEIKQELTNADGKANDLQKTQLKKTMAELVKKDPGKADIVNAILLKTKGLDDLSAADCEQFLTTLSQHLGE